jgi:hypothetical protein
MPVQLSTDRSRLSLENRGGVCKISRRSDSGWQSEHRRRKKNDPPHRNRHRSATAGSSSVTNRGLFYETDALQW